MIKKPILSICIPTYNRGEILSEQIRKYLDNNNNDFEIVVVDNASCDDSVEFLKEITDNRFKFYKNETNIGSFHNIYKTLSLASGKYIMMLMDKDLLDIKHIDKITDFLQKTEIAAGIFLNDSKNNTVKAKYVKNEAKKITNVCFSGNHPSGVFFNNNLIDIEAALKTIEKYDIEVRAYATDFLLTLLVKSGPYTLIDIDFIHFVLPPFDGLKHSFTYSPEKNNIFFLPDFRFKVFENYVKFLNTIHLGFFRKIGILKQLAKKMFKISTCEYTWILEQKNICDWYNITTDFVEQEKQKNLEKEFFDRLKNSRAFANKLEHKLVEISVKKKVK